MERTVGESVIDAGPALGAIFQPLSPFAFHGRRAPGPVVGRASELAAIQQELAVAEAGRLAALTIEGEPGIGKTRLLVSAEEASRARGFAPLVVAADEEIRGPFLLARSIVCSPEATEIAAGTAAAEPLARCVDALSGREDGALASLPADQKLLRTFDLGAVAMRALAAERPVALLVDDLQWADDDSLRFLRYIVRADSGSRIFLMASIRPEELAFVTEAVHLIADMERLGMVRRLKAHRFSQLESAELLKQVLGGRVDPGSAATIHGQAEGVPFILEELARTYRETGMIQEFDGVWTLGKKAERLVPAAVRTLISRRAGRLPEDTKASLAEAAVLGRHFSLKDLREVQLRLRDEERDLVTLEEELQPAVAAGLLLQHQEASPADYSFAHEDVREFAASSLSAAGRREVHQAIVQLLLAGDPVPESLPLLAQHARAAGDGVVCVRFATQATKNALAVHAPEEVLRVVDLALPVAATPEDRLGLLQARDEALDMLRRPGDRLEGLAELAALADALGDSHLAFDVQLRRAAALRMSSEEDRSVEIAERVRERAAAAGDRQAELSACLELGQDLLRTPLGEGFVFSPHDSDLDGAEKVFERAAELATELGDDVALAAATRELATIDASRARAWMVEQVQAGQMFQFVAQVTAGKTLSELIVDMPIAPFIARASERFQRAIDMYERIGDRRGLMSSVIGMAYMNWGPDIHMGPGAGRHIEEIRRVASRMDSITKESERVQAEGQMLYGVHVFARAKVIPDLALERGEDLYRHARTAGDRWLEFLGAGGTAMALLDLGDVEEAEAWLDRAASAAAESPTPLRARRLESWRGLARATAGDAEGMRRHLERAVQLAAEVGRPPARCEALARLALQAARLGAEQDDDQLLALAESAANEVKELAPALPGRPMWEMEADAALGEVLLARGEGAAAMEKAREALGGFLGAMREDIPVDMVRAIGKVYIAAGDPSEVELLRYQLGLVLAMTAMRTLDEDVRARWFRGPVGRELAALAGPIEMRSGEEGAGIDLDERDTAMLRLLTEGRTNREIAAELGVEEHDVQIRLAEMFGRIGASSRAEATAFALREVV
jgi:DNA-binding CsgD family transcriptional regulator/tetratricopeptide (TPR) repeat protein